MTEKPLFTTEAGIRHTWTDDGKGGGVITSTANVAPALEWNKAAVNHNDGYTPSREMRRVASIPFAIIHKWLVEDGVDVMKPENSAWLMRKLNDPDWAHLRTAEGQLGKINGGESFR